MVLEKSLTHSPLEVLPKNAFEASRTVFLVTVVLLRAKTYHKAVYRLYSSQPSDPDAKINIGLQSASIRRRQNFIIIFGFKSDKAVLTFTFRFLSSLLFSLSLPHLFSLGWAFRRLHFGGKGFTVRKLLGS